MNASARPSAGVAVGVIRGGQRYALDEMDRQELIDLSVVLKTDIDTAKSKMRESLLYKRRHGRYLQPQSWYNREAQFIALRKRQIETIDWMLSEIKQQNRARRPLAEFFVDAAKEYLAEEDIDWLFNRAEKLRSEYMEKL